MTTKMTIIIISYLSYEFCIILNKTNWGTEVDFTVKIKNIMIRIIFYFVFPLQNITRGLKYYFKKTLDFKYVPENGFLSNSHYKV